MVSKLLWVYDNWFVINSLLAILSPSKRAYDEPISKSVLWPVLHPSHRQERNFGARLVFRKLSVIIIGQVVWLNFLIVKALLTQELAHDIDISIYKNSNLSDLITSHGTHSIHGE